MVEGFAALFILLVIALIARCAIDAIIWMVIKTIEYRQEDKD